LVDIRDVHIFVANGATIDFAETLDEVTEFDAARFRGQKALEVLDVAKVELAIQILFGETVALVVELLLNQMETKRS
jgi:hypothetical protein